VDRPFFRAFVWIVSHWYLVVVVVLVRGVLQTCKEKVYRANLSQREPTNNPQGQKVRLHDMIRWKIEYDYSYYKVYDGSGQLAGYFFPHYGSIVPEEKEDEIIEQMNKRHEDVHEGTLLVPMAKLDLLDREEGVDIDYAIGSLEANLARSKEWKEWITKNTKEFSLFGSTVHTAREDRNMLSIALGMAGRIKLGEREVKEFLIPILDKLHEDGLL
jgi:hypothetical protein